MNTWRAHMLTGVEKMTRMMRLSGTCRTDESGPACRRGETRGAWRVARFAVVAVMAMVLVAGTYGSVLAANVNESYSDDNVSIELNTSASFDGTITESFATSSNISLKVVDAAGNDGAKSNDVKITDLSGSTVVDGGGCFSSTDDIIWTCSLTTPSTAGVYIVEIKLEDDGGYNDQAVKINTLIYVGTDTASVVNFHYTYNDAARTTFDEIFAPGDTIYGVVRFTGGVPHTNNSKIDLQDLYGNKGTSLTAFTISGSELYYAYTLPSNVANMQNDFPDYSSPDYFNIIPDLKTDKDGTDTTVAKKFGKIIKIQATAEVGAVGDVLVDDASVQVTCSRVAPTVTISTANQTIITDGGNAVYNYTVTNNATGGSCGSTTFNRGVSDDSGGLFTTTRTPTTVTLAEGATSGTLTMTVTDTSAPDGGSTISTLTASEGTHTDGTATRTTDINIPCSDVGTVSLANLALPHLLPAPSASLRPAAAMLLLQAFELMILIHRPRPAPGITRHRCPARVL